MGFWGSCGRCPHCRWVRGCVEHSGGRLTQFTEKQTISGASQKSQMGRLSFPAYGASWAGGCRQLCECSWGSCGCSRAPLGAHRSHEARQPPLGAEEAVAVKPAPAVHTALQHVDTHNTGVHGIRVLPHGSLDDCVPRVAGGKRNHQHERAVGPKSGQPCSSSFVPTNTPEELGSGPRSCIPDPPGNRGAGGGAQTRLRPGRLSLAEGPLLPQLCRA